MGLKAEDLGEVSRLAALASGSPKSHRSDIYMSVARLFQSQGAALSERERTLMRDILKRLTLDVEMAIRIALAERLADDAEAPLDLILLLADDDVEVARPIILRSRKLGDEDILEFLRHADVSRQTLLARRPDIGEPVSERLAQSDAEPVLVALVRNATARIANTTFETLVEKSRRMAALQEPLAHRADLPAPLAQRMCAWTSDALKTYIVESRRLAPPHATEAVDRAVRSVATVEPHDGTESGRKLVEKLALAGQLKPGFLVRVLQQGQADLFDTAFAKLLEVEPVAFREVFYTRGARPVALACRAVGIDRCVFPTIYKTSRQARRINPSLTDHDRSEIEAVFVSLSRQDALGIFRRIPGH